MWSDIRCTGVLQVRCSTAYVQYDLILKRDYVANAWTKQIQWQLNGSGFPSCLSTARAVPPGSRDLSERLCPRLCSPCERPEHEISAPPLPCPGWTDCSHVCGPPGSSAACRPVSEHTHITIDILSNVKMCCFSGNKKTKTLYVLWLNGSISQNH